MRQIKATASNKRHKYRIIKWVSVTTFFLLAYLCYVRIYPTLVTWSLVHAIKQGNLADAKLALHEGANPNASISLASGWDGESSEESNVDLLKALLGEQIHHFHNSLRETPLLLATLEGRDDITQLLIVNGADVRFKDGVGSTALQWAAHSCNITTVRLLIARGADINSRWKDGTPIIDNAYGRPEIIAVLKQAGAKG